MPPQRPHFRRVLIALAVWFAVAGLATPSQSIELGETAPTFQAASVNGGRIDLESYRGKVVYLDFWASWCGPCAQALPALDRLRQEFPDSEFQVVAVNVDRQAGAAKAFLNRRPVGYPTALDPAGDIPGQFSVQTMPTSFLIDRDGVVRHVHRGFRPSDVPGLRKRIQALVATGR